MTNQSELTQFINKFLSIEDIRDPGHNGLQVEGKNNINKVVFGVSAGLELFKKAITANADMIIVHHGLIWDKPSPLVGYQKERYKILLENDINLAAYHLPLDIHPIVGNNAQLISALGITNPKPFGKYKGKYLGYKGTFEKAIELNKILDILRNKLEATPFSIGDENTLISSVGIVSGGAPELVNDAINENLDLFITGEATEYIFELCKESSINFIAAGHYNSEKLGIKALMELIKKEFDIKAEYIDIPNPI